MSADPSECVLTWAIHVKEPRASDPWRKPLTPPPWVSEIQGHSKAFLGPSASVERVCIICPP